MSLFSEAKGFLAWLVSVLWVLSYARPTSTWGVVVMVGAGRVTNVLAFFLPLKVILLAGSEGVPRYFQGFIDPEQKTAWIIWLTVAAFVSFIVTLVLERSASRAASIAGAEVAAGASEISVVKNQDAQAQAYFGRICGVAAYLLFMVVGFLVGMMLNPPVFLAVAGLLGLQFLFSWWVLRPASTTGWVDRIREFADENPRDYTKILSSTGFLVGFLVILHPFVLGDGENILIGVLSVVLLRQTLNVLPSIVGDAVSLVRSRHKVDALVFPQVHFQAPERKDRRAVRDAFRKRDREADVRELLSGSGVDVQRLAVTWADCAIRGLITFTASTELAESAGSRYFQLQVFAPQVMSRLEDEQFLFGHLPRKALNAPEVVGSFAKSSFACQLMEFGDGRGITAADWPAAQEMLLLNHWSCLPPDGLLQAFASSRGFLAKRLNGDVVARMEVAADSAADVDALATFESRLPEIQGLLNQMPVYVQNSYLNRGNLARQSHGELLVMSWSAWTLEPIGAVLPRRAPPAKLRQWVAYLREHRDDISTDYSADHLRLASFCYELERAITREKFNQGLRLVHRILKNPVVIAEFDREAGGELGSGEEKAS
ncbi:hypothetical protein M0534_11635 [Methylonatrum kenyense]|uniref:hypothetical protein n=1 Tax=Methylonatrum kenyense TaxID=455253 RepID=UPI0020BF3955|nr:hypothetical protein [Methylonatrum kenyense]MCK8516971.1 hypothetical protein [Methylonatrum kenyense]